MRRLVLSANEPPQRRGGLCAALFTAALATTTVRSPWSPSRSRCRSGEAAVALASPARQGWHGHPGWQNLGALPHSPVPEPPLSHHRRATDLPIVGCMRARRWPGSNPSRPTLGPLAEAQSPLLTRLAGAGRASLERGAGAAGGRWASSRGHSISPRPCARARPGGGGRPGAARRRRC